ncbi:MAG: TSUP family transporter [Gemmatimonadaceae bacterium]
MSPKVMLLIALGLIVAVYIGYWAVAVRKAAAAGAVAPGFFDLAIGFVTNFFDTLGIGSFAPTTSVFKFRRTVPDERIPGTLNVGHTLPTVAQAFIFIALVQVEFVTLVVLIAAAVLGAYGGAGIVCRWPRRNIQIGMGAALLVAATIFTMQNLNVFANIGSDALSLSGTKLVIGFIGNFALGALMTLGIGLYAPCMILVSLLGLNPTTAFPIMMGSCAFLMPIGSMRFIKEGRYSLRPALGLVLGGIPAVLIAALIVKSLPVVWVRWLVVVVVLYAATMMLRSALGRDPAPEPAAGD